MVVTGLAWGILSLAWPLTPVAIHVRWADDVGDTRRVELERQFTLTDGELIEGNTWKYQPADWSRENLQAIVQHPQIADTHHLDRGRFLAEFPADRPQRLRNAALAIGAAASILVIGLIAWFRRPRSRRMSWRSELVAAMSPSAEAMAVSSRPRLTAVTIVVAVLTSMAIARVSGASFASALGALAIVYVGGYLVGSLVIARVEDVSLAVIRTVAGLMLTSIGYLLSLMLSWPWFVVPAILVVAALGIRRRRALAWPAEPLRVRWDGLAAALLAAVILSPIAITFFYMAPGRFPPVLYNVDTAYSLEKVHALVQATSFPPPSLGNLGVARTYHYGTQAMAAAISRGSALLPHHALFLIVLPLLAIGVVAAAFAAARELAPMLPRALSVPLLLISVPGLSRTSFWDGFVGQLRTAAAEGVSLDRILGDAGMWGMLSNEAQNVGGDFLTLGVVAGIAAAPRWGWLPAAFLIGASVLFKTTGGIALVAGFALAEGWRALAAKNLRPSPQIVAAGAVFAVVYGLFFVASFDSVFRVAPYPFEHVRLIVADGGVRGWLVDVVWLLLPALIVLTAGIRDPEKRSAPFLLMAVAPLIVMNATRLVHVGDGGEGAGLDWVQISHPVPFLAHAFALSLAGRRWTALGRPRRIAFLVTLALAIAPAAAVAARYSSRLLDDRRTGHEFVDNRPVAEALATIPVEGSLIVTNDLRYPADDFRRDDRQIQLPALFGHQAFAVNFSYEPVEHRRDLQRLLQRPQWSDAIQDAARVHRWTHFVVRKDFVHPAPIPLEQTFENDVYEVYRFR